MTSMHNGPAWSHRSGQPWLTTWTPELVATAPDPVIGLANYMQQTAGLPFPTLSDLNGMRKVTKEIFEFYPTATWYTMCRVVQYVKAKRRRPTRCTAAINMWREAMAAGYLNELDPAQDQGLIDSINRILETETEPRWRARLMGCLDNEARRLAISDWRTFRAAA